MHEIHSRHGPQGHAAGIQNRCQQNEDINDHREHRHDHTGAGVVAVFQKFRHRVNTRAQKPREQCDRDQHNAHGADELPRAHGQPYPARRLPGHAHHLLGRNVRRHNRDTNQRPRQSAASEEEVGTIFDVILRAPAFPNAEADDDHKKTDEDNQIEGGEVRVHDAVIRLSISGLFSLVLGANLGEFM